VVLRCLLCLKRHVKRRNRDTERNDQSMSLMQTTHVVTMVVVQVVTVVMQEAVAMAVVVINCCFSRLM